MPEIITAEMEELRRLIAQTVAKRDILKREMEAWYDRNKGSRFEFSSDLITVDSTLSELDSHYKRLWDYHNGSRATS
ncbi:MAG: hypothetical protein PHV10_01975 [Sulfuricurvum sp.]|nr:hypothetical protein [Sulfuricurvum sp.]